jgi:hypothetical protein
MSRRRRGFRFLVVSGMLGCWGFLSGCSAARAGEPAESQPECLARPISDMPIPENSNSMPVCNLMGP